MKMAIFVGPSLPNDQILQYLKISATIFPPIKRGDIDLISREYSIIAIIDGVFHGNLSVSARELFLALNNKKIIYGSSSMGALRAAELSKFGMIGVGEIFRMYQEKIIVSDGEVAMLFSPIGYENITLPLVNIRYGINQASKKNVISQKIADQLVEVAQSIHYTELDYFSLLKYAESFLRKQHIDDFIRFISENREEIDLKKKDAIMLIDIINSQYNNEKDVEITIEKRL